MDKWSKWRSFPNPRKMELLHAPVGYGVYQIRNVNTDELILFGRASNIASRLCSLLPPPFGKGTRNNKSKKDYVITNFNYIQYRTISFESEGEMKMFENSLRKMLTHKFNT